MSSFRSHRVVIASLFLPTTAVLGESAPPTPEAYAHNDSAASTIPAVAHRLASVAEAGKPLKPSLITSPHNGHTRSASNSGPLKSIVDDLKDKVRTVAECPGVSLLMHHTEPFRDAQHPLAHHRALQPVCNRQIGEVCPGARGTVHTPQAPDYTPG